MEDIMGKQNLVQIGAIAKGAGVNIQTLRYYERRNILKPAQVKVLRRAMLSLDKWEDEVRQYDLVTGKDARYDRWRSFV